MNCPDDRRTDAKETSLSFLAQLQAVLPPAKDLMLAKPDAGVFMR